MFKEDLQGVVNDLAVPIRVAHYPAYCSKFNPIERRLFSHVTRACQGVLFDSLHTVKGLIQKTKTHQGLTVTVRVLDKLYEGGRTVSEAFNSILKFFQVDITGMFRMTSCARYFKAGVGSSRPNGRWIMCFVERPKTNTSWKALVKRLSVS